MVNSVLKFQFFQIVDIILLFLIALAEGKCSYQYLIAYTDLSGECSYQYGAGFPDVFPNYEIVPSYKT